MSGSAAEGKAGICSLSLWPGLLASLDNMAREAHLTQNNILTDGKTKRHLSRRRGSNSFGIYNHDCSFFYLGLLGAIFSSVHVD